MFEKLADFIMKNAKLIVTLWIVALLIAVPFILKSTSVLQYDMDKMSTKSPLESVQGQEILNSGEFNSGAGIGGGTIILIEAYDSLASAIAPEIKKNLDDKVYFWEHNVDVRSEYGVDYQVTIKQLGRFDDKYFADKDTQMIVYVVNYPDLPGVENPKNSNYVPEIRSIVKESIANIDGITKTYVTGTDAISYDTSTGFTTDIKHIDPISVLLVLILIGLFFRSFVAAGTPPVVIGMAYGILLAIVYAIGVVLGVYYITTILVLVSMLGAGCDYCIFIVSRYREERKEGKPHKEALRESIVWAGESIITSGLSVIIGFGSLMLCSFSLVSTMGMVLAIGIVLALLAALTFIPSLLMLVGDKIFWPSKVADYKEGSKVMKGWYGKCAALGHKYFTHSAQTSIKYAKVIFAVTLLISAPLIYVAATSNASYDMIGAMPDGEAKDGVAIISENIGGGLLMPTNISMKVDAFVDLNVNSDIASGDVIPYGSTVTLKAAPRTGYIVQGWIVSDSTGDYYCTASDALHHITLNDDRTRCEIDSIDKSKTVTVVYAKASYTVNYNVDDPATGSVSATYNGQPLINGMDVSYGSKLVFTAAASENYRLSHWTIDRGDGDPEIAYPDNRDDKELSIDRASYDYTITACFVPNTTDTVTISSSVTDGHGSLVVRADNEVTNDGSSVGKYSHVIASAIPNEGYMVEKWVINGIESPVTDAKIDLGLIENNATIAVVFKPIPVEQYQVTYATSGDGTLTVTSNGDPIASGISVNAKSKVVFTATPGEGQVVIGWEYKGTIAGIPYDVISYVSKTEHVITSISSDENVTVIFGTVAPDAITVTPEDTDPNGSIYMLKDGKQAVGTQFHKGDDLFFTAKVNEGCHITHWTVNGVNVNTTSNNLSLYNLTEDTTVSFHTEPDNYIPLFFGANDESLGSLTVTDDQSTIAYSERANANMIYNKINDFTQDLMAMETDGKKNVAIAIGPINGDVLFDGEHEWIFDTVWNILPQQYKKYLGNGETYDALVYGWSLLNADPEGYYAKQMINYYITYKLGFISEVFTDKDSGQEYQYIKIMVVTRDEPMSALSVDTIKQVYDKKDTFLSDNSAEDGGFVYAAFLSGAAVSNYEMSEMVNTDFNFIIFIVVGLLIILLFLVMNSYLTPIRAVLTIVMSVLWTLGLTYIIFQHLLGMPVVWIVPIVLFVVCLGLGMDYDILLTTRIKEFVSKGHTNDEAITLAVQKSGAVITLCGLIMAGAFGTMMMSSSPMLKEFGFALGFAIAVDALIIRTYIVPAIMHLMGDWNWKGPNLGMIKERVKKRITAGDEENE